MKKDITKMMNKYRECVRNIWNVYFTEHVSTDNQWDLVDEFDRISSMIFSSLVLAPIDCASYKKSHTYEQSQVPLQFLHVIPSSESGVPVKINREVKPSGYWDYPIKIIKPSDIKLRFIDFFDFNLISYRDLEFYRVRIVSAPKEPKLIGRDALINVKNCKVWFIVDGIKGTRVGPP